MFGRALKACKGSVNKYAGEFFFSVYGKCKQLISK